MPNEDDLERLPAWIATALREKAQIRDIEHLWQEIGSDALGGVSKVALQAGLLPATLATALADLLDNLAQHNEANSFSGLPDAVSTALRDKAQINTMPQLWQEIGADTGAGIRRVAQKAGLGPDKLANALSALLLSGAMQAPDPSSEMVKTEHDLEPLPDNIAKALRKSAGITSLEKLWQEVGKDPRYGLVRVAGTAKIQPSSLAAALTDEAERSIGKPSWSRTLFSVVLIMVACGAVGVVAWLISGQSAKREVWVASRDLPAKHVIRNGDIMALELPVSQAYITAREVLSGSVVIADVAAGDALSASVLQRQQLVAAKDIAAGDLISLAALTSTLTSYVEGALLNLDEARGHRTASAVGSGQVIIAPMVVPTKAEVVGVILTKTSLPAYHLITNLDIATARLPEASGFITDSNMVIGRYTLMPLAAGESIVASQLSQSATNINPQEFSILQLPVQPGTISPALSPPMRITLLLSPRDDSVASNRISNVLLLDVIRSGEVPGVVVALGMQDVDKLQKLVGSSTIIVATEGK